MRHLHSSTYPAAATLLALTFTLGIGQTARAQAPPTYRLSYQAPERCPDVARFSSEVAARLGRVPFAMEGPRLEVSIHAETVDARARFLATFSLGDSLRAGRNGDCEALVVRLAEVVAAALERPQAAPAEASRTTAPEPAAQRSRSVSSSQPERAWVDVVAPAGGPALVLHRVNGRGNGWVHANGNVGQMYMTSYGEVCEAPCASSLRLGRHQLAIAVGSGLPQWVAEPTYIRGATQLSLTYDDRSGLRGAGWLLGISSVILGGVGSGVGFVTQTPFECVDGECQGGEISPEGIALASVSLSVALIGGVVGWSLGFLQDAPRIEATPR